MTEVYLVSSSSSSEWSSEEVEAVSPPRRSAASRSRRRRSGLISSSGPVRVSEVVEVVDLEAPLSRTSFRPASMLIHQNHVPIRYPLSSDLEEIMQGVSLLLAERRIRPRRTVSRLTSARVDVGDSGDDSPSSKPTVKQLLASTLIKKVTSTAHARELGSCPICLGVYKTRMSLRVLPGCGHELHKTCFDDWVRKGRKWRCPLDNLRLPWNP